MFECLIRRSRWRRTIVEEARGLVKQRRDEKDLTENRVRWRHFVDAL